MARLCTAGAVLASVILLTNPSTLSASASPMMDARGQSGGGVDPSTTMNAATATEQDFIGTSPEERGKGGRRGGGSGGGSGAGRANKKLFTNDFSNSASTFPPMMGDDSSAAAPATTTAMKAPSDLGYLKALRAQGGRGAGYDVSASGSAAVVVESPPVESPKKTVKDDDGVAGNVVARKSVRAEGDYEVRKRVRPSPTIFYTFSHVSSIPTTHG